jgi:hypothetical protein
MCAWHGPRLVKAFSQFRSRPARRRIFLAPAEESCFNQVTMKKLHFSTLIQAPRSEVWDTLIGAETYRDWTSVFCVGSYFAGSWNTGDRIQFLAPSGDGMAAVIAENRLHEFISIKHIGTIASGVEDTTSESVRAWAPAFENFTFTEFGNDTELTVDLDILEQHQQYMLDTYPKALARLKLICEAN